MKQQQPFKVKWRIVCLVSVVWFRWTYAHRKMIRMCGLFWLVSKFVSMNLFLLQFIAWCSFIVIGQKFYILWLHMMWLFFFIEETFFNFCWVFQREELSLFCSLIFVSISTPSISSKLFTFPFTWYWIFHVDKSTKNW